MQVLPKSFLSLRYLKSKSNFYISWNFLTWILITVCVLLCVIGIFEIIEKIRTTMGRANVTFDIVLELSFLKLPQHIVDLMPFVFFIANLLNLWKFNQSNELTALRAMGVSGAQLALASFVTSCMVSLLLLFVLNPISASCNARLYSIEQRVLKNNNQSLSVSSTGFWLRESSDHARNIFHAKSFQIEKRMFYDVTFYEFLANDELARRIDAKSALLKNGKWQLSDVVIFDQKSKMESVHKKVMELPTDLTFKKIRESSILPNQIPFWRLPETISSLKQNGMSTITYDMFWHRMWAEIGLLGAMAVLAVGFCVFNPRNHATARLMLMALLTGFLIHFLNKIIHAYGEANRITPFLSAWIPPLITGFFGVAYLMHIEEKA